jgi:hypothetical protein
MSQMPRRKWNYSKGWQCRQSPGFWNGKGRYQSSRRQFLDGHSPICQEDVTYCTAGNKNKETPLCKSCFQEEFLCDGCVVEMLHCWCSFIGLNFGILCLSCQCSAYKSIIGSMGSNNSTNWWSHTSLSFGSPPLLSPSWWS